VFVLLLAVLHDRAYFAYRPNSVARFFKWVFSRFSRKRRNSFGLSVRGPAASINQNPPANPVPIPIENANYISIPTQPAALNQSSQFAGAIANTQNDDVLKEAAEVERLLNPDSHVFIWSILVFLFFILFLKYFQINSW